MRISIWNSENNQALCEPLFNHRLNNGKRSAGNKPARMKLKNDK